jgi:DNA polymerase
MNFSREDVLRELELLPVWKLRAPITTEIQPQVKTTCNTETQAEIKAEVKTEILPVAVEPSAYVCTVSDDKKWAFIWPASLILSASQSTLFKNILVALKITKSTQMQVSKIEEIQTSVIILMGEEAAQKVLGTVESIETLRGKSYLLHSTPTIVTYHPSDLLQSLQLKPKTWEDLCLAKGVVNT